MVLILGDLLTLGGVILYVRDAPRAWIPIVAQILDLGCPALATCWRVARYSRQVVGFGEVHRMKTLHDSPRAFSIASAYSYASFAVWICVSLPLIGPPIQ